MTPPEKLCKETSGWKRPEGLRTYREQLAVAYHHEIDEVAKRTEPLSRLGHALRVRYRALRLAIYHRRAEARKQKGK